MESYAGNGNVNYHNGHYKNTGTYNMPYNSQVAPIKFESEPYHAVEGDPNSHTYGYTGNGSYPSNTFQTTYEQEFGTQQPQGQAQEPYYNNYDTTAAQPKPDTTPSDKPKTSPSGGGGHHACDICGKVFSSNPSMRRHREIHSGQKKFSCKLCGNSYTQKHNLTKHMRLHTGEKPYACTLCDKAFYIHHHLKNHMLQHTGQYPYPCVRCGRGFKHKTKLDAHMLQHEDPSAVIQSQQSGLTSEDNSMSEVWAGGSVGGNSVEEEMDEDASRDLPYDSLDEEEKTYVEHECEVCQQIFISKESLDNHMKLHSVDREFKCEECNNIFLTRAHLVRHRKIHTGETIYNCEECNVSFRWKVSLHIHMRRHNNDYRRHECNLCNKYFLSRPSLKKHLNTHMGSTTYDCEECGDKFIDKLAFKDHLQTKHPPDDDAPKEMVIKPTCKTCHKTFSSNSSLRKHEYTHMDVKPHKCEICNVSFAQKIQLRLHNKKHNANGVIDPPMTLEQRRAAALREREKREALQKEMQVQKKIEEKKKVTVKPLRVRTKPQVVPERRNAPRKARNVLTEDNSEEEEPEEEEEEVEEEGEGEEGDSDDEEGSSEESDEEEDSDDDEEEESEEDEEDSQDDQNEDAPKKTPWQGYRYPVCGQCKKVFKKKSACKRHERFCRNKH